MGKKDKKNKEGKNAVKTTTEQPSVHPINRISGSINLTAFKSILTKVKNKEGKKVDALVIPLDANFLSIAKNGNVYLNIIAWANKTPNDYSTHMVKMSLTKEMKEDMSKEEQYALPILGNLQALVESGYTYANNSSKVDKMDLEEQDDDLPF